MALVEPKFISYMKEMFSKHGGDYFEIVKKHHGRYLSSNSKMRDKPAILGHFYYFICAPKKEDIREELKIVGITSIIEALMGDIDYKDPFAYFDLEHKGQNSIQDFKKFKKEYLEKYGATRRIISYFNNYIPKQEMSNILNKIKTVNYKTGKMSSFKDEKQFAEFLYQMRSDFVHKADMVSLCSEKYFASLISVGNKSYDVRFSIANLMEVFEKSFVNYWMQQYPNNHINISIK